MMDIAILYICTGKYSIFWKDFFASCEEYFFPGVNKEYFVFTDKLIDMFQSKRVHRIEQTQLGWPHDTLQRFCLFLRQIDHLKDFDLIFFCNANVEFLKVVGKEILPQNPEAIIVTQHPGYVDGNRQNFPYEENVHSLAYIAPNEGNVYVCGGFNGGYASAYLRMVKILDINIREDLEKGLIARWHDESHLNRYILDHPYKLLPVHYCFPQFWNLEAEEIVRIRDKLCYGGTKTLRGGNVSWYVRSKDMLCYVLYRVGLLSCVRRCMKIFRRFI